MKQYFYTMVAAAICMAFNSLSAADTEKVLCVETMKYSFDVPFTDKTTIVQLKELILKSEGVPVEQQLLKKKEWVREGMIFPAQESILLEDDKTCSDYDLQNKSTVQLFLQLLRK